MSETAPLVRIERHGDGGHVAELVLDRPEAMNAVSTAMAQALADATRQLAEDATVRSVVVSSTHGRAFCVGADLKERNSLTDDELRAQRPLARGLAAVLAEVAREISATPAGTPAAPDG